MDTIEPDFEWDAAKRSLNITKHGLDFIRVTQIFDGRFLYTYQSTQGDEIRYVSIGELEDCIVAVVWTERETAIRIISARRARHEEKTIYHALYSKET